MLIILPRTFALCMITTVASTLYGRSLYNCSPDTTAICRVYSNRLTGNYYTEFSVIMFQLCSKLTTWIITLHEKSTKIWDSV